MIKISNLQVTSDNQTICQVNELQVTAGERLAILGVNGSGKTTLLRVLAGLEKNYSGDCHLEVAPRQRTFVHQQPYLFRGTVKANVCYGQKSGAGQESEVSEWLQRLQIDHLAQRSTADLSGGERRRVALARALITQPKLLLLDEPLADLDDTASKIVCQALTRLIDTTILIASPIALPDGLAIRTFSLS